MYAYLKGRLVAAQATSAVVDVQGIGFTVFIPVRLSGELPALGEPIQFFTAFVVREASQALYGFLSTQERDLFEELMNVTGIGPKLALALIGHLTFDEMLGAIAARDLPTLCRVPGVGKKTAERLVVELKDKLPHMAPIHAQGISLPHSKAQHLQDAMLALINLGYNQNSAQKALKATLQELPETTDLALLITTALKKI